VVNNHIAPVFLPSPPRLLNHPIHQRIKVPTFQG